MAEHRRFFGLLCAHEWEEHRQSAITRSSNDECVGVMFVLRCKHCGDLKSVRVQV